jgi:3-phenylpropionate/trans-cinnamate dioxygenase ferredoxin component
VPEWFPIGRIDDFEVDLPEEVQVGGQRLAVHPTKEGVFVTDAMCTHEDADLCDGLLEGCVIVCPLHLARFDVRTGAVLGPPASEALVTYPCEQRDGVLYVGLGTRH